MHALMLILAVTPASPTVVTIDPARVAIRRWEGFGCSLSWWGVFTQSWSDADRKEVCRRLFGRGDDCLGWNVVRYNAGGTAPDADPKRFRPGGKVQVTLDSDGSWRPERDRGQIDCLRQARALGANLFELFVNSPPHWMLKSGDTHGGTKGEENLRPESEQEYARWIVAVAARIEREGRVRFTSIAPFNEPSAWWWSAESEGQEGCRILPPAQARVLKALRAELERVRSRRTIACSDENEPHTGHGTLDWLTDPARGGLDAKTIGRLNVHAYSAWEWQDRLRELAVSRGITSIWMSEVSHREWENAGYVPNDMRCALPQTRSVVNDLKRLRPSAWVYWQAVEPLQFCLWYHFTYGLLQAAADAPVEYEGRTLRPGQFVVSKAFWAMMQFSRFIRPGDRILQTDDFWTVAALSPNGKRLTLIVHNDEKAGRELQFDLRAHGGGARTVRAWRTMDDGDGLLWNCRPMPVAGIKGDLLTAAIPPRSVTTYVIETESPKGR